MKNAHPALLAALLITSPLAGWTAEPSSALAAKAPEQQVDALLAKWNQPDMPGCAVEVIRDGKVLLRKGVGMADIEHGAPIQPSTEFHVASMSKQFTAFAIHLLAKDGKLSLDDDIRKHLPEMPDFGKTITIRHLLQHTSGLRDQWNLLNMSGWRFDDVITQDDVLGVITRQRELNFAPGQEHLYSNTGYTLLATIVQRVSGKPLPVFATERIFEPLGMQHTFFHEAYGTLVPGRALSYTPARGGGYQYMALSYSTIGPSSLFTTVDDLALWDRNFYDAKVGGKELLANMQKTGMLNNGKEINYASGLVVGTYRGLRTVDHGGADAGFRSQLLRFPDQHFSVAVLGNGADVNAQALAQRIADIYLADQMQPRSAAGSTSTPTPKEVPIDPARLDPLVGYYAIAPEFGITFTKENGQLMAQATGQDKFPLFASSEREFFLKVVDARFTFDQPGKDGIVAGGVLHQNGRDMPAKRTEKQRLTESELKAFEGEFYSDELHVLYTVALKGGKLMLTYPRGTVELEPKQKDEFMARFPLGLVKYRCTAQAGCSGFTVTNGRVRDLQFAKVAIVGQGAHASAATGVFLKPETEAVAKAADEAKPAS